MTKEDDCDVWLLGQEKNEVMDGGREDGGVEGQTPRSSGTAARSLNSATHPCGAR